MMYVFEVKPHVKAKCTCGECYYLLNAVGAATCPGPDDLVNKPAHYNKGGIECIDTIKAATGDQFSAYLQGNAMKYLYRHRYKDNPVQDLEKAIWYINKLIEENK